MTANVQVAAVLVSLGLLVLVVELVRRRQLSEEHSLLWILCALALLLLSLWRDLLHTMARWLGIFYPPALLLLVLIAFAFIASLYFSVITSRQRRQIERLVEDVAVLDAELRDLQRAPSREPGGESG